MTYVESWEEFAKAAERLYSQSPWKVRFCVKYRHCDGALVLKITDDKTYDSHEESEYRVVAGKGPRHYQFFCHSCVKYQTDQLQDVKKLEKLNNSLMRHMVSKSS